MTTIQELAMKQELTELCFEALRIIKMAANEIGDESGMENDKVMTTVAKQWTDIYVQLRDSMKLKEVNADE